MKYNISANSIPEAWIYLEEVILHKTTLRLSSQISPEEVNQKKISAIVEIFVPRDWSLITGTGGGGGLQNGRGAHEVLPL